MLVHCACRHLREAFVEHIEGDQGDFAFESLGNAIAETCLAGGRPASHPDEEGLGLTTVFCSSPVLHSVV